ncbi:MAG: STAS domain-containing protein [Parachlamydiaceae bacterium]|nr:STAS domain-containing protein [Parachlamydiaceae bacterium]
MDPTILMKEAKKGDVVILHLTGKLDSITSATLEKRIFEAAEAGTHKLVLNFSEITYISSCGLRALLAIKKRLKSIPGKVVLCNLNSEVLEMMKICGFDHVLDIVDSESEALRHF